MIKTLIKLLLNSTVVYLLALWLHGIHLGNFKDAVIFVILLTVIQIFVKPLIIFLTIPITLLTFGLFYLAINGICVWLAAYILPTFHIDSFLYALLFSFLLSFIQTFLFRESTHR